MQITEKGPIENSFVTLVGKSKALTVPDPYLVVTYARGPRAIINSSSSVTKIKSDTGSRTQVRWSEGFKTVLKSSILGSTRVELISRQLLLSRLVIVIREKGRSDKHDDRHRNDEVYDFDLSLDFIV